MEEVDKDPEETPEPCALSESEEAENSVSTQEGKKDPSVTVSEENNEESQNQEEEESQKSIVNLQRDLTTLVTNIQTAADARELVHRTELEEARRNRLKRLEDDAKSSQEKFEEITKGWSIVNEKVILQELQKALNSQQQLCAVLIGDKKKLINNLQQELKLGDDYYVKILRQNTEEMDLMIERMEDQIKVLTEAYREELAQTERVHQEEIEVCLTKDKSEWEQHLVELWDKELERLMERRKKVEENEAKLHNVMLESTHKYNLMEMENKEKFQAVERQVHLMKGTDMVMKLQQIKHNNQEQDDNTTLAYILSRISSLQADRKKLKTKYARQEKEFTKKSRYISEDLKRFIQRYERIQKKIKYFEVADARKFEEMWLMIEAEVKQLVKKALAIDSQICEQHLGVAWKQPAMAFMELSGPIQPQKQASRLDHQLFQTGTALQCSQEVMDASVGPSLETDTKSSHMEIYKEGTATLSESDAEVEEGRLSMETLNTVLELLCDETGFLVEEKTQRVLAPLEKEVQARVKLDFLISSLGIEREDVPKLADFLLKYKQEQREQTEDVCAESSAMAEAVETSATTEMTSEFTHPNHILPALKNFLKQHRRSREISVHQHSSFLHVAGRDTSQDEAYWESMGSIISEDKIKLWDEAESRLKQYHEVLTEISELVPETERLKQQNTELRLKLQQSLSSTVGWNHDT